MARLLSEREYAAHRGCAHSTVQAARKRGRLGGAVTTDSSGRIWIDADVADREWERKTAGCAPLTGPTAPRERGFAFASPSAPPPPRLEERTTAGLVAGLLAIFRELQADEAECIAAYLPAVVQGAHEALHYAGREPTPNALAEVLTVNGADGDGAFALVALQEAIGAMELDREGLLELARNEGRRRVWERLAAGGGRA